METQNAHSHIYKLSFKYICVYFVAQVTNKLTTEKYKNKIKGHLNIPIFI